MAYIPPAEEPQASEPVPQEVAPATVNIAAAVDALDAHFHSDKTQVPEPVEPEQNEDDFEESLVIGWSPSTGFGDLRRQSGETISFASWAVESIRIENIKPYRTWVRHHVETIKGRNGLRTVACDIWICM